MTSGANPEEEIMPLVSLTAWNQFLSQHPSAHLLQTGEWGELKSAFGWKPARIISDNAGVQILFRKLPLGFTIGYIPKPVSSDQFWKEIDQVCRTQRAIFLKLEPDSWNYQKSGTWNLELRTSPQHPTSSNDHH